MNEELNNTGQKKKSKKKMTEKLNKKGIKTTEETKKANKKKLGKLIKTKQEIRLDSPKFKLTKTSLVIVEPMNVDEFMELGNRLHKANQAIQWWIGDWINIAGSEPYYKENPKVKAEICNVHSSSFFTKYLSVYSKGYLSNIEYVCREIVPSRRREKLSFSHHQEVASLSKKEQDYWLDKAEKDEFSVKTLRGEITKVENSRKKLAMLESKSVYCVRETGSNSKLYSYDDYFALCETYAGRLNTKVRYLADFSKGYFDEYYDPDNEYQNGYITKQVRGFRFSLNALILNLDDLFEILNKHAPDTLYSKTSKENKEILKQCITKI